MQEEFLLNNSFTTKNVIIILISYLIGSTPTAYLLTKIFKGIDIRTVGSKNPGATNVLRTTGVTLGVVTLVIDFIKGVLPILIAKKYLSYYFLPIIMFFVVFGHTTSPFLYFRGGKGVATFFGSLSAISPYMFVYVSIVFIIAFLLTRIVSVSSIISTLSFLILILLKNFPEYQNTKIFFLLTVLWIVYRHKSNIKRIILKEEKKLF